MSKARKKQPPSPEARMASTFERFAHEHNAGYQLPVLLRAARQHAREIRDAPPSPKLPKPASGASWRRPAVQADAMEVIALADKVKQLSEDGRACEAAAHAIRMERAYQRMQLRGIGKPMAFALANMVHWRGAWIEVKPRAEKQRAILAATDECDAVPLSQLVGADRAFANQNSFKRSLSSLNTIIRQHHCPQILSVRDDTLHVTSI